MGKMAASVFGFDKTVFSVLEGVVERDEAVELVDAFLRDKLMFFRRSQDNEVIAADVPDKISGFAQIPDRRRDDLRGLQEHPVSGDVTVFIVKRFKHII